MRQMGHFAAAAWGDGAGDGAKGVGRAGDGCREGGVGAGAAKRERAPGVDSSRRAGGGDAVLPPAGGTGSSAFCRQARNNMAKPGRDWGNFWG